MRLLRVIMLNSASSLALFGVAALLLAFGGASADRTVVRLVIELPLLLLIAATSMLAVNFVAALAVAAVKGRRLVGALIAALLAWEVAGPPEFAGLGYHPLLRPAFAIAVAVPWLVGSSLLALLGRRS